MAVRTFCQQGVGVGVRVKGQPPTDNTNSKYQELGVTSLVNRTREGHAGEQAGEQH